MLQSIIRKRSSAAFGLLFFAAAFFNCASAQGNCCGSGAAQCNAFGCGCQAPCAAAPGDECRKMCDSQYTVCGARCPGDCGQDTACRTMCYAHCQTEMKECYAQCSSGSLALSAAEQAFLRFARHDKDHDGHLTREEFAALAKAEADKFTTDMFDQLDKDQDGRVSLAEADIPMPKKAKKPPVRKPRPS